MKKKAVSILIMVVWRAECTVAVHTQATNIVPLIIIIFTVFAWLSQHSFFIPSAA
jgi:hypothetical protein